MTFSLTGCFYIAAMHLTDNYLFPVPSQFMLTPKAMERLELDFSVLGYTRALAYDSIAMTGGNMDAPL